MYSYRSVKGLSRGGGRLRDAGRAVPMVVMGFASLSRGGSSGGGSSSRGLCRSGRCGSGSGSGSSAGSSSGGFLLKSDVGARAANTRDSDVVGVSLKSKVLESVAVFDGEGGVVLSEVDSSRVLLLFFVVVVLDDTLTDLGNVEKTVKKVRGPEGVGGTVGDIVSEHAHGGKRPADFVGQIADDRLGRSVGATPVTGPAW
jgi:hypothetical protein